MATRKTISIGAMALSTLLVAALATAASERMEYRELSVSPGGKLTLDSDLGSVTVNTESAGGAVVEVVYDPDDLSRSELEEFLASFKVSISSSGNNVDITAEDRRKGSGWFGGHRHNPSVKFLITVPRSYNLDLQTGGGSISVEDLQGEIRARTSGGSLKFGEIDGTVWGRTSGGSIRLSRSSGEADLHTSGGSIDIGEVAASVRAHTSGGSISVDEVMGNIEASTSGGSVEATITKQPTADCRLTTSGGSVTVRLASGIGVDVDARGNRVRTDFPMLVRGELDRGRLEGSLNGGGPLLYLRTSGGAVRILER